jgi:hypothetical protein
MMLDPQTRSRYAIARFVVLALLLLCAALLGAEARAADAPKDQAAWVERAISVGADGVAVVLYDEPVWCQSTTRRAAMFFEGMRRTPGCWFEAFDAIWVMWADGDLSGYPKAAFAFSKPKGQE